MIAAFLFMRFIMHYPLENKTDSYRKITAAKFNSMRSAGKRRHAGIDLYCKNGGLVYAIADGIVHSINRQFMFNLNAIALVHKLDNMSQKCIVRYCELILAPEFLNGTTKEVKEGDVLGYVKMVDSKISPMLHLEMYTDVNNKESLTNLYNKPYFRRKDLIDP